MIISIRINEIYFNCLKNSKDWNLQKQEKYLNKEEIQIKVVWVRNIVHYNVISTILKSIPSICSTTYKIELN